MPNYNLSSKNSSTYNIKELTSMLSVDRAVSELRRGCFIIIKHNKKPAILAQVAETISGRSLKEMISLSQETPYLAITSTYASALKLNIKNKQNIVLKFKKSATAKKIASLANPLIVKPHQLSEFEVLDQPPLDSIIAGIELCKIAQLLPTICFFNLKKINYSDLKEWGNQNNILIVEALDVLLYKKIAPTALSQTSEARVPIRNAEKSKVLVFEPPNRSLQHLAIIFGNLKKSNPILTRIHSECITGDLLGSMRCDCGEQLQGAIDEIIKYGSGLLIYLRQEGRGIGLVNKLRSYELQDKGHDTFEANKYMGFNVDERTYSPAAKILNLMKIKDIRLMTNNPEKIHSLMQYNITVTEQVPHSFSSNKHNEAYIRAKNYKTKIS